MQELSGAASVFALLLVSYVLLRLIGIENRVAVLSRVDAKLDMLLKQAGLAYEPFQNLSREVVEALRRGEKIQAIQHYREATGVGLREAKAFIEEVQRRSGLGG